MTIFSYPNIAVEIKFQAIFKAIQRFNSFNLHININTLKVQVCIAAVNYGKLGGGMFWIYFILHKILICIVFWMSAAKFKYL